MSDAAKAESRKVRVGVALVAVSLAGLVAAIYFTGGIDLVMDLIDDYARKPAKQGFAPLKPSSSATKTPDGATAPGQGEDVGYFREWMYWEQVDSQETIGQLVDGRWASFDITSAGQDGTTADLGIVGTYKSGERLEGTVVLRRVKSDWYFVKITSVEHSSSGPTGRRGADYGVVDTIVAEQAEPADQALIAGLKDGGYKTITVDAVKKGSGTATIDLTLSGGAKGTRAGRIVCITKRIDGRKYWFISRCEER